MSAAERLRTLEAEARRQEGRRLSFIHTGQVAVSAMPCLFSTIVATGIAVGLVDPVARVGGLCHFVLPYGTGLHATAARFGNVALARLVEALVALGAHREHLQAYVVGGMSRGTQAPGTWDLGASNVAMALSLLAAEGIPVVQREVGGTRGRRVVLDPVEGMLSVELL
jgi:chemotaxis protein CheD